MRWGLDLFSPCVQWESLWEYMSMYSASHEELAVQMYASDLEPPKPEPPEPAAANCRISCG